MPLDGRNFTETKPDVFSLEGLIAWLEKQPADESYCYYDVGHCLWGRYVKAMGGFFDEADTYYIGDKTQRVSFSTATEWQFVVAYPGDNKRSCTFGAALERARALAHSGRGEG